MKDWGVVFAGLNWREVGVKTGSGRSFAVSPHGSGVVKADRSGFAVDVENCDEVIILSMVGVFREPTRAFGLGPEREAAAAVGEQEALRRSGHAADIRDG